MLFLLKEIAYECSVPKLFLSCISLKPMDSLIFLVIKSVYIRYAVAGLAQFSAQYVAFATFSFVSTDA